MTDSRMVESLTAAYLARRGVAVQWRTFVRGLVETLDAHLDGDGRAALLRAVGGRMAAAMPLPPCPTLVALESQMNEALAAAEWGYCALAVNVETQVLVVTHAAAPAIGVGGDADGGWIGAVLEGLYAGWLAEQPGADGNIAVQVASFATGEATLTYGKAA